MQKYEIMVIIPNSQDAKTAEVTFKSLNKKYASEFGAKVTFEDFWGERGFAYMINKQKWGYYGVSQFEMDPAKMSELRHEMNLDNNVVRFLLTKVDPRAGEPRKYADMKKEYEALDKKKAQETKDAKPAPGKKAKLTTVKEEPAPAKAEEKTEPEAPAKDEAPKDAVDKKLDAIIDASSTDL